MGRPVDPDVKIVYAAFSGPSGPRRSVEASGDAVGEVVDHGGAGPRSDEYAPGTGGLEHVVGAVDRRLGVERHVLTTCQHDGVHRHE